MAPINYLPPVTATLPANHTSPQPAAQGQKPAKRAYRKRGKQSAKTASPPSTNAGNAAAGNHTMNMMNLPPNPPPPQLQQAPYHFQPQVCPPQPPSFMQGLQLCNACNQPIKDRYMLNALGRVWHEDCLKCSCCDCRLGEVGNKLFEKANLLLCQRDYLR